jgi:hypothetical protein
VAHARHKRDTDARSFGSKPRVNSIRPFRAALIAAPVAVVATAAAVTVGLSTSGGGSGSGSGSGGVVAAASVGRVAPKPVPSAAVRIEDRGTTVSRSLSRRQAVAARTGDTRWTTTALDLWKRPGNRADQAGEAKEGTKVLATGRELDGRVEIVVDGAARWVTEGYLDDEKPIAAAAGLSMAPCPDPGVESGLVDSAVYVYRSVCHAFPQITRYGGWDAHGEHSSGHAIDIMTSDVELGTAIAEFLQSHAAELNLYDILWRQHIWTPVRSGEGWRSMPSRGSTTANHYDHVHVSTN